MIDMIFPDIPVLEGAARLGDTIESSEECVPDGDELLGLDAANLRVELSELIRKHKTLH